VFHATNKIAKSDINTSKISTAPLGLSSTNRFNFRQVFHSCASKKIVAGTHITSMKVTSGLVDIYFFAAPTAKYKDWAIALRIMKADLASDGV